MTASYIGPATHWDRRFLELARFIAQWSKDPSTKVGAVIVDEQNAIVSVGFNGLPIGVEDTAERLTERDDKLRMVVHGERNAMIFAQRSLKGCKLYTWPFMPCAQCAGMVIQHGIYEVIAPEASPEIAERWAKDIELTEQMFEEANVQLSIVSPLK